MALDCPDSSSDSKAEIGISEFTFGYAFLFEQTQANSAGLRAAPILPSLQQKAQEAWDARLPLNGTDFYYHFKLSDYLSRGHATYLRDGTYNGPYYQLWLHRRNSNQQHRRLRQHCIANPNTYYAAPEFNSVEEFNSKFLAREVTANCPIIPLNICPDIVDGERHCITFQRADPGWIFHSEPTRRDKSFTGAELGGLYRESSRQWQRIDVHFTEQLLEKTREIAKRLIVTARSLCARCWTSPSWPRAQRFAVANRRHSLSNSGGYSRPGRLDGMMGAKSSSVTFCDKKHHILQGWLHFWKARKWRKFSSRPRAPKQGFSKEFARAVFGKLLKGRDTRSRPQLQAR